MQQTENRNKQSQRNSIGNGRSLKKSVLQRPVQQIPQSESHKRRGNSDQRKQRVTMLPIFTALRLIKKLAKMTGTNALNIPNTIVPHFCQDHRTKADRRQKKSFKRSAASFKVMVTASIDVVPNNTLMAIRPGATLKAFLPEADELHKCPRERKVIPQPDVRRL